MAHGLRSRSEATSRVFETGGVGASLPRCESVWRCSKYAKGSGWRKDVRSVDRQDGGRGDDQGERIVGCTQRTVAAECRASVREGADRIRIGAERCDKRLSTPSLALACSFATSEGRAVKRRFDGVLGRSRQRFSSSALLLPSEAQVPLLTPWWTAARSEEQQLFFGARIRNGLQVAPPRSTDKGPLLALGREGLLDGWLNGWRPREWSNPRY